MGDSEFPLGFVAAKRSYFVALGLRLSPALACHRARGLLDRSESGKRKWGNVVEHCLVEAARVLILGQLLELPSDIQADLVLAAGVHDFYKRDEKRIVTAANFSWEAFEDANEQATRILRSSPGISGRVVWLTSAVGHTSLAETLALLNQKPSVLSETELAYLAMHYIDDYTTGSNWVTGENVLAARIRKNAANSRYGQLNAAGRTRFGGRTTFEAQLNIGQAVEARLAYLVGNRSGLYLANPTRLPLIIDEMIKNAILLQVG